MLFQADIYNPTEFEPAITGCEYVFHVATPLLHNTQSSQVSCPLISKATISSPIWLREFWQLTV